VSESKPIFTIKTLFLTFVAAKLRKKVFLFDKDAYFWEKFRIERDAKQVFQTRHQLAFLQL
jgi:hypothetical protein